MASLSKLRVSSLPELAEDLAISQRQLEHLYRSQVGMTPTQYMRLQRVEIARLALTQGKQSNTRLAADLGYYDQAHFIHEFRSVMGITPHAYMVRKHQEAMPQQTDPLLEEVFGG
jgi:AraC-like DNA-binding protein